ncbi:M42 family metallopeptidase [Youngiibacter multivorans]|uniref:Aminopeptidase FrvX n=1 Tax=Youngiibacter multivorans TaxID=937251 RepID=A0ABS4G2A6_9CLOT|nr:M20/M25/M40 family metallo-hydrolase [Youngiibacter multivorans]MBP1918675.1 putative aminopeptidase FrvX [Youngiibacter multivorans]
MTDTELIGRLSNAFGPSGFEDDVVSVITEALEGFNHATDPMNNLYVSLNTNKGSRPIVMLDAHLDEVGFMVQYIAGNGLIGFVNLGGWIASNVPAHKVIIRNSKGEIIPGIITSRPPHFMTEAEKSSVPDFETMMIDVGARNREEVINLYGIQPGDPVAPDVRFETTRNGFLMGKAFDNRLGCYAIIETLRRLKDAELNVDVIGCFASQEEVGMRGAEVTGKVTRPDLAIVFEGSPSDDFLSDRDKAQGVLGNGTQIRHFDQSYVSNPKFIAYAKAIAEESGIRYQSAVRRRGSTDAGRIHISHKAVPVLVLGIPSRYVHTHYNYACPDDVEATISLAVESITRLSQESVSGLTQR